MEELGEHAFGGAVVPGDDPGLLQPPSGGVDIHVHASVKTLGDVDQDLAHVVRDLQEAYEPVLGDGVAGAVGLYDDGPGLRPKEYVADHLRCYAGVNLEDGDPCVEGGIDPEEYTGFAFGVGLERIALLKYEIDDMRLLYENDARFLNQF